jgi:pimeloyl-ACP methyl ester carboxylesterase
MTRNCGNVVLLHGRGLKPPEHQLRELWFQALRRGLETTSPEQLPIFDALNQQMMYYGDLSNHFLGEDCHDIEDRKAILDSLNFADFSHYPGETTYTIDEPPEDIEAYWDKTSSFSQQLSQRVVEDLRRVLDSDNETLLLAHSLGAVLIYDALAKVPQSCSRLTLVTLGSPLTLPHFMEKCKAGGRTVSKWLNVSARGDLICGPAPERARQLNIINPAMRDGSPDPHHALGYLCHPEVAGLVSEWLMATMAGVSEG